MITQAKVNADVIREQVRLAMIVKRTKNTTGPLSESYAASIVKLAIDTSNQIADEYMKQAAPEEIRENLEAIAPPENGKVR